MEFQKKLFAPSKKVFLDKACHPVETLALAEKVLKNANIKIYKSLKRIDKNRLGLPVYISIYDVEGTKFTGKYKQMGKGKNEILAKVSAIMELIERFSLFYFLKNFPKKAIFSTFKDLSEKTLPFEVFLSSVEDNEEDLKSKAVDILKNTPFYFTPSFMIREEKEVLFPFHWFWLIYEYNGSSAGNTYAECTLQGLCEVIERHVSALFIRKNQPLSEISLDSLEGEAKSVAEKFLKLGIKLWIRDITFDMPVPTIGALAMDPSTFPERSEIVFTAGTATTPEMALIRALCEVAQLSGDFDTEGKYEESGLPKYSSLEEAKVFLEKSKTITLSQLPSISYEDHVKELRELVSKLKEKGFSVFVVDVSFFPEIPVVYVCMPSALFRERTKISYLYQLTRCIANFYPSNLKLTLLEELCKKVKDRYYIWAYLGNVYKENNKLEEAENCYKKAFALNPPKEDLIAIYSHLIDLYIKKEEYDKAIITGEKALLIEKLPVLYNLVGKAFYKKKEYKIAMEYFLNAIELDPSSAVDYANIGYCLKNLGLVGPAEIYFRKALMLNPDLTMAKKGLEYCKYFSNLEN